VGRRLITGSPGKVRRAIEAVAEEYGAEEVLVVTITHDHAARVRSYELIAGAFGRGRDIFSAAAAFFEAARPDGKVVGRQEYLPHDLLGGLLHVSSNKKYAALGESACSTLIEGGTELGGHGFQGDEVLVLVEV